MPGASRLEEIIDSYQSVLVGFSGGVDSALVAVTATRVLGPARTVAALGVSASLAREQHDRAIAIADRFSVRLLLVNTDELHDAEYVANDRNRCFFCKYELWSKLSAVAAKEGIARVADGTNADDTTGHRPGMGAAARHEVQSPLMEAGLTKAMVRAEAKRLGITIWNAPAAPCLSSRIRYGLHVTPERLQQVERGERFLRDLGVQGDLRVRHHGDEARIEVRSSEFDVIREQRLAIASMFQSFGFATVTLDLQGYRSGSMLSLGAPRREFLSRRA